MRPLPEEMWATDVAALAGLPRRTVQRWCLKGKIPARRFGKLWLVKISILKERNPDLLEELAERWERRERKRSALAPPAE